MNKKTVALTHEQFTEIIQTMQNGFLNHEPNRRIATALVVEANLGIRISDIARKLTLSNIIRDGGRYRLDIIEQKTKKKRTFTVPVELYIYLQSYCLENKIAPDEVIFPISERAIQKHLALVCDYLGPDYGNISTHSFRKYFATSILQQQREGHRPGSAAAAAQLTGDDSAVYRHRAGADRESAGNPSESSLRNPGTKKPVPQLRLDDSRKETYNKG